MRLRLLIAGLLLALVACAAPPAEQQRRVSFMIFGDVAEKQAYESLVAAFEAANPDIGIDLIHIPGQSDYRRRLGVDFSAGTPADVVLMNYRRYAPFAEREAIEPLGPYLEGSELIALEDFYPATTEPFFWNGTLSCIPQNLSSLVVYYNRDLFAQAGLAEPADDWTWEDFLATAQALTIDSDSDGRIDQYGAGIEPSIFRLAPFVWQNGGDIVDDHANPTRLTLDTPEAFAAAHWFVDLQVEHGVVPDRVAEQSETSEQRFLNGRLAMFFNSRRGVPTYRQIEDFDWDVAPLPGNVQRAGILHSDAYCMAAATEDKNAAWRFIEYANSEEGQRIVARSGRTVPSLRTVAESAAFLDPELPPSRSRVYLDTIPVIRTVPVMATWVDIEELMGDELERAFYGDAPLEEVIARAQERARPFFEQ